MLCVTHSGRVRAGFDMGSFLFSTFAGLRGAVSLILAQQLVLDQSQYPHEARVIAEVRVSDSYRQLHCVLTLDPPICVNDNMCSVSSSKNTTP